MMTRKHFKLIAETLKFSRPVHSELHHPEPDVRRRFAAKNAQVDLTALCFASVLREVNPRFNREKFLAACGVAS